MNYYLKSAGNDVGCSSCTDIGWHVSADRCLECDELSTACTSCQPGKLLVDGACVPLIPVTVRVEINDQKTATVDLSMSARVEQPANISMYPNLLTDIKQRMPGSLALYDQDKGQYEQISADFNLKLVNGYIIMDMTLTQALQGHNYKAQLKQPARVQFKVDQTEFELQEFNYSFIYVSSSSTEDEVL